MTLSDSWHDNKTRPIWQQYQFVVSNKLNFFYENEWIDWSYKKTIQVENGRGK